MAKIWRGRLPPLMREALAEFMATFILVVSIGSINVICILNNSIDQLYILHIFFKLLNIIFPQCFIF